MTDLPNPTPEAQATATPTAEPVAPGTGTVPPGSDANQGQSAPAQDGFTHVDPNTLPPQLRGAYDSMLRDYKDKTAKLSERIKTETEQYRQKADFYDRMSSQEEFVKRWNAYVQEINATQAAEQDPTKELKQKVQELEVKHQQAEAAKIIDAFENAVDEKGQKINADFGKLNDIVIGSHQQEGEYSLLRAAIELASGKTPQERVANGYKAAKQIYDQIVEEGKRIALGRVQAKGASASLQPSSTGQALGGVAPRRASDALEALEFAKQGLAVPK